MRGDSTIEAHAYADRYAARLIKMTHTPFGMWRKDAWDRIARELAEESYYVSRCSVGAAASFVYLVGISIAYQRDQRKSGRRSEAELEAMEQQLRFYVRGAAYGLYKTINDYLHFTDDEREVLLESAYQFQTLLKALDPQFPDTS